MASQIHVVPVRAGVHHHRQIYAVQIASVNEFGFAAVKMDHALFPKSLAERKLNEFFSGNHHEADPAGQSVQRPRSRKTRGNTQKTCRLAVVTAGMRHAVHGLRMVALIQRVQFRHDAERRAGTAGVDIRIKARDVACFHKLVPQGFPFFFQIIMRLPLRKTGLGVLPDPALGRKDHLPCLIHILNDLLLPVRHVLPSLCDPILSSAAWFLLFYPSEHP